MSHKRENSGLCDRDYSWVSPNSDRVQKEQIFSAMPEKHGAFQTLPEGRSNVIAHVLRHLSRRYAESQFTQGIAIWYDLRPTQTPIRFVFPICPFPRWCKNRCFILWLSQIWSWLFWTFALSSSSNQDERSIFQIRVCASWEILFHLNPKWSIFSNFLQQEYIFFFIPWFSRHGWR